MANFEVNELLKNMGIDFNVGKPNLKNIHENETGIIIANGPSLYTIPIDFLNKYPSIGMNNIYLYGMTDEEIAGYPHEHADVKFVPDYYTILGLDQLNTDADLSYIKPILPHLKVMFCNRLLGPYLNYDNVYFIHTYSLLNHGRIRNTRQFSYDPLDRIGVGFTNTYVCAQIMFWLGFSTVYIVGLDNDYFADPEKKHFYLDDPRFCADIPRDGYRAMQLGSMYVMGLAKEAYHLAGRKLVNVNDVNNTPLDCVRFEDLEW